MFWSSAARTLLRGDGSNGDGTPSSTNAQWPDGDSMGGMQGKNFTLRAESPLFLTTSDTNVSLPDRLE